MLGDIKPPAQPSNRNADTVASCTTYSRKHNTHRRLRYASHSTHVQACRKGPEYMHGFAVLTAHRVDLTHIQRLNLCCSWSFSALHPSHCIAAGQTCRHSSQHVKMFTPHRLGINLPTVLATTSASTRTICWSWLSANRIRLLLATHLNQIFRNQRRKNPTWQD